MPFIDGAIDTLNNYLVEVCAPYQPNLLPQFPNSSPFAGTIPATEISAGNPIQNVAMLRVENQLGSVYLHEHGELGRHCPTVNDEPSTIYTVSNADGSSSQYVEIDRVEVPVTVEIWASTQPARRSILEVIQGNLGMYFRLPELDGTVSLYRYLRTVKEDSEQKDSLYIYKLYYLLDYTITAQFQAWPVKTTNLVITTGDTVTTGMLPY